jgi:REP element-mobilizing transposase RayT
MIAKQQDLPFRQWGGARPGAGRKRKSPLPKVAHRPRVQFKRGTLHITNRLRPEVWNLRTHRCFRALQRAFAGGCERFGFRMVHFSVQRNHLHTIVEAPDTKALGRAMKGLAVRMARALNKVMERKGPVFGDRYHAHLIRSLREAANAVEYVLENWRKHLPEAPPRESVRFDPYCSAVWYQHAPPLTAAAEYWILRVEAATAMVPLMFAA